MQELLKIFTQDKSRSGQNGIMLAALLFIGYQVNQLQQDMASVKGQIEYLSRRAGYEAPTNHAANASNTNHLSRL